MLGTYDTEKSHDAKFRVTMVDASALVSQIMRVNFTQRGSDTSVPLLKH